LLFDPDEQYLLYVGGNSTAFSFETLEKIVDNTEIKITNLHTEPTYENQDYIVGGLARG
jgi:phage terminase large subunit